MPRNYLLKTISYDGRSLALFRIMLGIVVLADLVDRALVFEVMYTEEGLTPLADLREIYGRGVLNLRHFSLHMLHGSAVFQGVLFVVAALCAVALVLGWKTRLFTILSWALHASLLTRNPVYGSAADPTLTMMLFWSMWLPLGATFSLDRRRRNDSQGADPTFTRVGGACYLAQVCLVYVCAALAKGSWWHDGSALLHVMQYDMVVTPIGFHLSNYPGLLHALTRFSFYLELLGPGLLFIPFRRELFRGLCVLIFMGFHLGIALTLDIGLFPFFSLVLWLPFVPGRFWDWIGVRPAEVIPVSRQPSSLRRPATLLPTLLAVGTLFCILLTAVPILNRVGLLGIPSRASATFLSFLKLKQTWSVFANQTNMNRDGWFSIQGTLPDGREVDIMRGLSPVDYEKPTLTGEKRRLSIIWMTYLAAQERNKGRNLDRFARYLNRKQKESQGGEGFTHIRMVFMEEPVIAVEGQPSKKIEFWSGPPPE